MGSKGSSDTALVLCNRDQYRYRGRGNGMHNQLHLLFFNLPFLLGFVQNGGGVGD